MDGGLGEALGTSVGPVPELAAVVQFLADNAGLIVLVISTALLMIMVLTEVFLARRREGSSRAQL